MAAPTRSGPHAAADLAPDATRAIDAIGARPAPGHSRLAMYALLGGSADALPLPLLPDALVLRVRGALVHDVAARYGVSLTKEARAVLAAASASEEAKGVAGRALTFLAVRLAVRVLSRFGPVGALWPARQAARTYVLGHLFERYVAHGRRDRAVRIDAGEARRVRIAIDGAVAAALSVQPPPLSAETPVDDQRDALTILVDGAIGLAAGVPDRLLARLDAAFDALVSGADG